MKANGTFPPATELGTTPSGRIFDAFHHLQLVPAPDLLRLRRALDPDGDELDRAALGSDELNSQEPGSGASRSNPARDLLQGVNGELSRRREQSPQAG